MCRFSIFLFSVAVLAASCGGPRIIPDRELARIFHDIYLVNTLVGQRGMAIDSLNIYEPVFASYGYTVEDLQYTIGNFAKRKSARLSEDVVEVAGRMLLAESRVWQRRMHIADTVASVARKRFAERMYFDSLIRVRRVADTALLRVVIEDIRPGNYEVSYGFFVDSLDRNLTLRAGVWLVDSAGRRSGSSSRLLDRAVHGKTTATLTALPEHRALVLALNGYGKEMTTPRMSVDSLSVVYHLPDEIALARLSRSSWGGWGGPLDSLLSAHLSKKHETNIVAPGVDAPGIRGRQDR